MKTNEENTVKNIETSAEANPLLAQLDVLVERWHLLQHPFYQAWTAGTLPRKALALYAEQYYHHVRAFPENLARLASRSEGELRSIVEENLAEENHPAAPHPKLWRDFAHALQVNEPQLSAAAPLPGFRKLLDTYRRLATEAPVSAAVAAFYVYEAQVPEIATQKIDGLRRFYGINTPEALSYFSVHEKADVAHRAAWRGWLAQQPAAEAGHTSRAAAEALEALWDALTDVTPATC